MPSQPPKDDAGDFVKIGGNPVPGLRLTSILKGQSGNIQQIAWSPDGRHIAAPSISNLQGQEGTVRIWDMDSGRYADILRSSEGVFHSLAFAPDSQRLVISSDENRIVISGLSGRDQRPLQRQSASRVWSVDWSPDGKQIAAGSQDGCIHVWNAQTRSLLRVDEVIDFVQAVSFSPNSQCLAYACADGSIGLFTSSFGQTLKGHSKAVWSLDWSPNGEYVASGSADTHVRIWDGNTGRALKILEGHASWVVSVRFSAGGKWLASKSSDGTVRLWRCDTWDCVAVLPEVSRGYAPGLAFHPQAPVLATLGDNDTVIRLWQLDEEALGRQTAAVGGRSVHYTTAKVVLVGDSGVGKTGLGFRLCHGQFKEHASTHGQQFWVMPQLRRQRGDGTQCEAVLWDLAGQPVYRQAFTRTLKKPCRAAALCIDTSRKVKRKNTRSLMSAGKKNFL